MAIAALISRKNQSFYYQKKLSNLNSGHAKALTVSLISLATWLSGVLD
jgi:hypothetical protein